MRAVIGCDRLHGASVAPGTHFALVLDLRPARGIHVYAPGAVGYKPVALRIEPQRWVAVNRPQLAADRPRAFNR